MVSATGVVGVCNMVILAHKRLFDVPKNEIGNRVENFTGIVLSDAFAESFAHVFDVVVLFAFLEDIEFFAKDLVPLFRGHF